MQKSFGTTIKHSRLANDLSLRDLSKLTDLDHSYIGRLEKDSSVPSRETIIKLAKALRIPKDELMVKAGYAPNNEANKEKDLQQVMINAVSDDPELSQFLEQILKREDLKVLYRQTKDLSPDAIKRIIKYIKLVEDEEATEDI